MILKNLEKKSICSACGASLTKADKAISFKSIKSSQATIILCEDCCRKIKEEMLLKQPAPIVSICDESEIVETQISDRIKISEWF